MASLTYFGSVYLVIWSCLDIIKGESYVSFILLIYDLHVINISLSMYYWRGYVIRVNWKKNQLVVSVRLYPT